MTPASTNMYDQMLYSSLPTHLTHPDHMAALALLHGMEPAPLENCRVLELGCGNGANLVPMALTLPGSRFTGIDLAAVPIASAESLAAELNLTNIDFHQVDLMAIDEQLGHFDYIIAHGLYSWVPPQAREKLMAICRANLAPSGVAFISYNTYPGCHLRRMLREMLQYQTAGIVDPELRLRHAYAMVNFLAASNQKPAALTDELTSFQSRHPSLVFHDDLEPVNDPVYFHEFIQHAGRHGLRFLSESEFFSMQVMGFPDDVVHNIGLLARGDRIKEQQYLDFLRCRRFRQTLLCHEGVRVQHPPDPRHLRRLYFTSQAERVSGEEFRAPGGASMTTNLPLARSAVAHLAECWPAAAPFGDLAPDPASAEVLAGLLLNICAAGVVDVHAGPSRFTLDVSQCPRASALARLEAQRGDWVTTLRHSTVELEDDIVRRLVVLLDGTRDRAALLRDLQPPQTPADLERNLAKMARLALLEK